MKVSVWFTCKILCSIVNVVSAVSYDIFNECDPRGVVSGERHFTICAFKANSDIDLQKVDDVHAYYSQVSSSANPYCCRTDSVFILLGVKGKVSFVGKSVIPTTKVKRNQFTAIVSGLPNHNFGYVVFGDLTINTGGSYTVCTRSDDG